MLKVDPLMNLLGNLHDTGFPLAATTRGGVEAVSPEDDCCNYISSVGLVRDLRVVVPEPTIQQEFESDLQEHITYLIDTSHSSAKSKETSALFHMNIFLSKYFQKYNKATFGHDFCKAEDLQLDLVGSHKSKWWDDMTGQFCSYLAFKAVVSTANWSSEDVGADCTDVNVCPHDFTVVAHLPTKIMEFGILHPTL